MKQTKKVILVALGGVSLCLLNISFQKLTINLPSQKYTHTDIAKQGSEDTTIIEELILTEVKNYPEITVDNFRIYKEGIPIEGVFASWHVPPKEDLSRKEIAITLNDMQNFGITGVGFEVPWSDVQPREDTFIFPKRYDLVLDEMKKRNMHAHVLFSAHYTPTWVFEKYNPDIRMQNKDGEFKEGSYLTFSPFSPAIKDVAKFQIEAAKHYLKYHDNIIAFYLTNENAYGDQKQTDWLDYGPWAQNAWQKLRKEEGLDEAKLPHSKKEDTWPLFTTLRTKTLLDYFNYLYSSVKNATKGIVPISHKLIFYETTASFADVVGLQPIPNKIQMDIVGTDLYGKIPNAFTLQDSFHKPTMLVETNIRGIHTTALEMYNFLIYQWFKNPGIMTLYRWNAANNDENTLWKEGGLPYKKTFGAKKAIQLINDLIANHKDFNPTPIEVAILLPENFIAQYGYRYWDIQNILNNITELLDTTNLKAKVIWSSELEKVELEDIKLIVALSDRMTDTDPDMYESKKIAKWVRDGGTFILESRDNDPDWITKEEGINDKKTKEIGNEARDIGNLTTKPFAYGQIIYTNKPILSRLDQKKNQTTFFNILKTKFDIPNHNPYIIQRNNGYQTLLQATKDTSINLEFYTKDFKEAIHTHPDLTQTKLIDLAIPNYKIAKDENIILLPK